MQRHRRPRVLDGWSLPTPYPDELSISVVGRYLKRWDGFDHKRMVGEGLGLGTRIANLSTFPVRIFEADAPYPFNSPSGLVARRAIWDLTLAPYYLSFQHPNSVEISLRAIECREMCTALTWLAMPDRPRFLRFCPMCFDDESSQSEPYWHRSHQLPFSTSCEAHRCLLLDSTVLQHGPRWNQSRPPERANCPETSCASLPSLFHPSLIAHLQNEGLRALKRKSLTYNFIPKSGFRKLLQNMGYRSGRNLRAEALEDDFRRWVKQHGGVLEDLGRKKWWLALFTDVGRNATPVQVILFRRFLRDIWSESVSQLSLDFGTKEIDA